MHGTFVWYDLAATDLAAGKRFYAELLGWTTEPWPGSDYTMWKAGDVGFGGLMPLSDDARKMGAPPHWLGYLGVADADQAAAKCLTLGGKVYVPGTDIPGAGRFAVLADPTGGTFAVFASSNPGGEAQLPIPWQELSSTDPDAAFAFYQAMFGWRKTETMEVPGLGTYTMVAAAEGDAFAGIQPSPPQMPMSAWAYYFACLDARATFARATAMGAKSMYDPIQVPGGGWAGLLQDPQGVVFGVFSME
jgi:uncharacterized protein